MAAGIEHLTESQAHYKRRLEAFSDIVFGLSLSELALQLGLPMNPQELISSPIRYFVFFGSFGLVCSLWIGHHRMFRVFTPIRAAVALNFVYLAFTVLMPFGMQAFIKYPNNPIGIGIYLSCYAGTAASMCGCLYSACVPAPTTSARTSACASATTSCATRRSSSSWWAR